MRAYMHGAVVEKKELPWDTGQKKGVAYIAALRDPAGSASAAAEWVTLTVAQFGGLSVGDVVTIPVDVSSKDEWDDAQRRYVPTGKLRKVAAADFDPKSAGLHAVAS